MSLVQPRPIGPARGEVQLRPRTGRKVARARQGVIIVSYDPGGSRRLQDCQIPSRPVPRLWYSHWYSWRRRLSHLFDDDAPRNRVIRLFNLLLALLIVLNVAAVILETVEPIRARYEVLFLAAERAATAIFATEYLLRVWTAVDLHGGRFSHPLWGRLRYMRGFFSLIDLVSVLPAMLGVLGAGDLRVLRLLRLLRMLKLTRHSPVFSLLWSVFRDEAQSIGALLFILCLTLTVSGALAYMIEGDPAVFNSIPAAMWWAIETLTTVGYGDMVPATAAGKLLGGLVSIVGIGTLALFSGVITVGFLEQLKTNRGHHPPVLTPAGDKLVREIEPAAGPLTRGPWQEGSASAKAVAVEISCEICPHCGHRLSLDLIEPAEKA
jgi:voltage-gated potassium channel